MKLVAAMAATALLVGCSGGSAGKADAAATACDSYAKSQLGDKTYSLDKAALAKSMAAVDPQAKVEGKQHDLAVDLVATTDLPGAVFKHRLKLLAGSGWQLRDVTAA